MATINGTSKADTKYGTTSSDTMYGYGGNDNLYGRAGNDQLWGGIGNDSLFGEAGNDTLRGEDGGDFLYGGDGNDIVLGGLGDDNLYGDAGTDTLRGEGGNDTIKGGTGIAYLYGGDGNDSLYYDPTTSSISSVGDYLSGSILNGDAGIDTLSVYNKGTTPYGPAATDIYVDNSGVGRIYFSSPEGMADQFWSVGTFQGIEKIVAVGAGGMRYVTDPYNTTVVEITGTSADDEFYGGYGNETMRGGAGNDRLLGHEGRNNLYGDDGNDTLVVEKYSNVTADIASVLQGGTGTDTLHGNVNALIDSDPGYGAWNNATFSVGFSSVIGGTGSFGFSDRQERWVEGYQSHQGGTFSGIERVTVEPGTVLEYVGGMSNVTAIGGNLPDYFHGGSGNETFIGGGGGDLFDFSGIRPHGLDRITGFNAAEGDLVTTRWSEKGWYTDPVNVDIVESSGHTIVTSSKLDGTVFHVLDIDAVGVQNNIIIGEIWG